MVHGIVKVDDVLLKAVEIQPLLVVRRERVRVGGHVAESPRCSLLCCTPTLDALLHAVVMLLLCGHVLEEFCGRREGVLWRRRVGECIVREGGDEESGRRRTGNEGGRRGEEVRERFGDMQHCFLINYFRVSLNDLLYLSGNGGVCAAVDRERANRMALRRSKTLLFPNRKVRSYHQHPRRIYPFLDC